MRCKYIRKIFQNEENGYTVALFSTLDHEVPLSARDKFWADKKIIAFTAKGYDLPLTDEIEIEMEGEWETNSHGTQYKVETFWKLYLEQGRYLRIPFLWFFKRNWSQNGRTDCQSFWSGYLGGNGKVSTGIIKDSGDISEKTGPYCGFFWKKQSIPGIDDFFITVSCYA